MYDHILLVRTLETTDRLHPATARIHPISWFPVIDMQRIEAERTTILETIETHPLHSLCSMTSLLRSMRIRQKQGSTRYSVFIIDFHQPVRIIVLVYDRIFLSSHTHPFP